MLELWIKPVEEKTTRTDFKARRGSEQRSWNMPELGSDLKTENIQVPVAEAEEAMEVEGETEQAGPGSKRNSKQGQGPDVRHSVLVRSVPDGMQIDEQDGDGKCIFRAIAHALHIAAPATKQLTLVQVRAEVRQVLAKTPETYKPFLRRERLEGHSPRGWMGGICLTYAAAWIVGRKHRDCGGLQEVPHQH